MAAFLLLFLAIALSVSIRPSQLGNTDTGCQNIELMRNLIEEVRNYVESRLEYFGDREDELKKELYQQEKTIEELRRTLTEQEHKMATLIKHFQENKKEKTAGQPPTSALNPARDTERAERGDDLGTLEPIISHMTQQLTQVTADVQVLKNANTLLEQGKGTAYIRWGHAACPNTSNTVYSGSIGGSWYDHGGAAANHLCLPNDPVFGSHRAPSCASAYLYGAEYDTCPETQHDMNPVCALCHTPRSTSVMIAATNKCWSGWTLEYSGYLMAGYHGNGGASEWICVDQSLGYEIGSASNDNGRLLHYTVARCGSLSCPPYLQGNIILCAVCSK